MKKVFESTLQFRYALGKMVNDYRHKLKFSFTKNLLIISLLIINNAFIFSSKNNNQQYDDIEETHSDNDSNSSDIVNEKKIIYSHKQVSSFLDEELQQMPQNLRKIILNYINIWEKYITLKLEYNAKCAAFSPDSKYLMAIITEKEDLDFYYLTRFNCSLGENETVEDNNFIKYQGQSSEINTIAYSPDGKYIASGSADSLVRIFATDTKSFNLISCDGMIGSITSVIFSSYGFLAAASKNLIHIWNFNDFHSKGKLENRLIKKIQNDCNVTSLAFSQHPQELSYGCIDGKLKIFDCATLKNIREINIGQTTGKSIYCLAYSPKQRILAAASSNIIKMINTNDNSEIASGKQAVNYNKEINALAYCKDGKLLFLGFNNDFDNSLIQIWDSKLGESIEELVLNDKITFVICSNDNKYLAIGSGQNIIIYKSNI